MHKDLPLFILYLLLWVDLSTLLGVFFAPLCSAFMVRIWIIAYLLLVRDGPRLGKVTRKLYEKRYRNIAYIGSRMF